MAIRIDGKEVSTHVRQQLKRDVADFHASYGYAPGLAVVLVGDDPASAVYVRNKHRACEEVGIYSEVVKLPANTTEEELLSIIERMNGDVRLHGILVQLPLPGHINEEKVVNTISPEKDVDAFSPVNVGKIMLGNYDLAPCTPAGVMELLKYYKIDVSGKNCVVVGRSNIVGKPQAMLLLEKNATVTICHSKTKDLSSVTREADILVVAVGRPGFIRGDMVKDRAVVIDVGINRLPDGKLCGDVRYDEVFEKAYAVTPVPGGVGPMTITMLLRNTLSAASASIGKEKK